MESANQQRNRANITAASTPVAPPGEPGSWDYLPVELRIKVLSYRLVFKNSISPQVHRIRASASLLPLARTSKQMYQLATEVYYSKNQFTLETANFNLIRPGFYYPPARVARWIRHLIIKTVAAPMIFRDFAEMCRSWGGWRYLSAARAHLSDC
ncbi:hypothetical protein BDW02DRAFT_613103 [Decorospora gaudefroyi]|uniref:F-box domain-containing protein n=1 Tax=Decorospora gaudefroyi TaxID=184978 RepID=A0A6A5JZ96_9PLEO|nr:hypothetical protein BDW02DRAFT_613103 [Decorospora gaudefroyi]